MAYPLAERQNRRAFVDSEYKRIASDILNNFYESEQHNRQKAKVPARRGASELSDDAFYRGEEHNMKDIPLSDSSSSVKNLSKQLSGMYRNSLMSEGYYGK